MPSRAVLARSLRPFLSLGLLAASLGAEPLETMLPADLHLVARLDVAALVRDLPEVLAKGVVAERLENLRSRGFPDPTTDLDALVLGGRITARGLDQGLAVANGRRPVVPSAEKVAAELGVTLSQKAYRGATLVSGVFRGVPTQFADLRDGLLFSAHDLSGKLAEGAAVVDLMHGAAESFAARHRWTPGTGYASARMVLPEAAREGLEDSKLKHLAHVVAGSLELAPAGNDVTVETRVTLTGSIKARLAGFALGQKLEGLKGQHAGTAIGRVLASASVDRDGATLVIKAKAPRADLAPALDEVLGLAAARKQASRGQAD